jgi:pentatricopeptide repeat protein
MSTSNDSVSSYEYIVALLAPMWVEILFMVFFLLGFSMLRVDIFGSGKSRKGKKSEGERSQLLHKQIEADVEAGHTAAAMKTWNMAKALAPTPLEGLKVVAQMLLDAKPDGLVEEIIDHFATFRHALNNARSATPVLDVVARAGRTDLLDQLTMEFSTKLNIQPSFQTYEVLLGGHASAGNQKRVNELCAQITKNRQKLTARGYSLMIKGYLKNGMADAALCQIQEMHRQGFFVPSFAVTQLFRTACSGGRGVEVFDKVCDTLQPSHDALIVMFEDCHKRNDLDLALRIEKIARESPDPLPVNAYDPLLKICVGHASLHALELFENMKTEGLRISEGLCVGLLARCADSKFLRFAEEIAEFVRGRDGMTIAVYSALMKVYAYCGLYDKACDLYKRICEEGLEPDSMMYGCLMKFSVECGRTDLSRELFQKAPALDIQNYMSLIRAAGRDKDVDRAFSVLEKLKKSGASVDIAAYNCVLDACVSAGEVKRARTLMQEMKTLSNLDIITYNTLMKGYCSAGDIRGAKDLLLEMEQAGLAPNDVSYNCLINVAVSTSNFREAWNTIDMMEKAGVAADHYTISIMMKALKKVKDPKDVSRALDLLDQSGVDVFSDEVLLNTVLETCTRHRKLQRLESIINGFAQAKLRPSVHTYGSLIKASSTIKNLDKCHQLWHLMVDECALQPNDIVLGCMLDALVCNGKVEEAVSLLNAWKSKVTPNTVMYSTIIKGFANARQASRALDMWEEMCEMGVKFNTVVYNALIDSQARVGAMEAVSKLVKSMEPNGVTPDAISYSTIVKGYCVKGDLDNAFEVFRYMQANGMAVDSISYNTVMDGCTRHNRMDLVDLVLEDMEKYNIKPSNFTLGILVKMYGRRRQLDKAFQVIEDLPRRHGVQVNSQVRTCLMTACLSNQNLDRAMEVFADIKRAEGSADAKVYGSLISGLVRLGQLEKAVGLVDDAYGLAHGRPGLTSGHLDAEVLEQLARALAQRKLSQSIAMPLLDRLRAARIPVSSRLLSIASPQNSGD